LGVARSFVRLPIPSQLTSKSVISSATLYTTEEWAPTCTKTSVRLYTTTGISSSTTWNNQPTWSSGYSYQDAAWGYPGCAYNQDNVNWDVTSAIKNAVGNQTTQTWGIRAADETDGTAWKQFFSGANSKYAPHMTVYYDDIPNHPVRSTSPGGSCQYSAATAPAIGNDDVTFYAGVSDDVKNDSLTTRFLILNSTGTTVYDSQAHNTSVATGNNATAPLTLNRSAMQGLQSGGSTTAYTYHWYAMTTTTGSGLTNTMPADECYFTYNPNGPSAPAVTVPASGQLGQQVAGSFSTPGCGSGTNPCPASYTYQLGAATPVTVTAGGSGNWSGNITIPRVGPMQVTVYGTSSAGNLSEAATQQIDGTAPSTPYKDGDINGDGQPDLLTVGTSSSPGLWLSPGSGTGTLGAAADIGGAGTGISPGTDGPADWTGTTVLHGDFTGNHVQDAMDYYPAGGSAGTAIILGGTGDGAALQSADAFLLPAGTFADPLTGDYPSTLVAAGNASQADTGTADLIGVAGDSTNGYSLDLFTDTAGGGPAGYGYATPQVLSAQSPDGATPSDWNNFTLATAQPGGNPSAAVLFALKTSTGALYESTNPAQSATTIIGTGNWQQITVPWGTTPPALLSGDINSAGQAELWARSGSTITSYSLTGTTLAAEHSGALSQPLNDWPLAEGAGTTTADTITGQNAALTGGATWITGDVSQFANHIRLDGTGYLTPPATAIPTGTSPPKISIWFKTTSTAGGILVATQKNALSSGPALPSQYDPVLYVGGNGKLYGEWWNGSASPAVSATPVDDGIWHHAVLTASTSSQTLYLDGVTQQTLSGATSFQFTPANLTLGAGYIGGNWPSEPNYQKTGSSDYRYYLNGEIAAITYSYPGGP
ncbi:MAG: LamG-like jellyroll fold domain-containing protein, partial [Streptosporangiaceae bacterium]